MEILLREIGSKILALDPAEGYALTRIDGPPVPCANGDLWACYEYPEGICWTSWSDARAALVGHEIVTD